MNDLTERPAASAAVAARMTAATAILLALLLAACGGGGAAGPTGGTGPTGPTGGTGPTCTVTGVTVGANPAAIVPGGTSTLSATLAASAACATGLTWSVTPGGGTLAPSGATATFTSATQTTYTITATSVADPTRSGSATVTVVPPIACAVAGVTVSAAPATIAAGGTATLTAAIDATASCSTALTWTATPGGGTLTPSAVATTATFTSTTQTAFTITATSVADPTRSGSATVTVGPAVPCGQKNGTVIEHRGDVTASETWVGDGTTHYLPAAVDVTGSAVLTIEGCAFVELGPRATMTVRDRATLLAAGSPGRSISISAHETGIRWGMLRAFGASALVDLRYTTIREGGELGGIISDPTLAGFGDSATGAPAPVLRAQHVAVEGSSGLGVYLDLNATFTADSTDLTITKSGSYPIAAPMMSLGGLPAGAYTGNAKKEGADAVLVRGASADVSADLALKDLGVPYLIPFAGVGVHPVAPATAPVTLTLQPGVILQFPRLGAAPGALVTFGTTGSAPDDLLGVLNAVGTAAKPIVFTSGQAAPAAGDWKGLWLAAATGSRLDHVEISFAGAPSGLSSANCRPAGASDAAALTVGNLSSQYVPPGDLLTNSLIADSAGFGIDAVWQAATFSGPDLTGSNAFLRNARCSQTFNGLTAGTCPAGGGCTAP